VLASWPSTSANCSLVLSLQWGFDHEQVEDVGLLAILLLVIELVVRASSQLGSLSIGTILGPGTGKTVRIAEGGLNFYFSFSFLFYFIFHF